MKLARFIWVTTVTSSSVKKKLCAQMDRTLIKKDFWEGGASRRLFLSKKEKHEDRAPTKSGKETTEKRPKVDQASPAHGRQQRAGSDTSVPMPRADKDGEIKEPGAEQGTRSHLLAGRKERCGRLWQCCLGCWKAGQRCS